MNMKQLCCGVLACLLAMPAFALEPWAPTAQEMAALPPFCSARFNEGSAEYKSWNTLLGPDFGHTHHYCAGINFLNRYYRDRTEQAKRFNLNNARSNLQYMIDHADPAYSLMPDVYLNLGVVYSLSGQPAQAITHFIKAIELNPRLPRAYNALADYYAKTNQAAKALETVTEGLRYNPGTRSLQRRYTELGGKLPYPAPAEPQPQVAAPATAPEAAPMPITPTEKTGETTAPVDPAPASPKGSATNPYCRFCPD